MITGRMTSSPRSRAGWGSISHERRASLSLHEFPCEAVDQIERAQGAPRGADRLRQDGGAGRKRPRPQGAAQMSVKPTKLSLEKALHLLRKPDARLVRLHSNNGGAGFYVWPGGGRVPDEVAQQLLGRNDIQPYDSGLFPGHPQSWRLGNWREWAGRV